MLHLVDTHRHDVAVVDQDVGGHQHRVGEQPGIGRQSPFLLVLVRVALLEPAEIGDRQQQPGQFRHFRHIRLPEQGRLPGVQAQREQVQCRVAGQGPQLGRVADRCQGVQVGDEIERLLVVLQSDVLANGTKVVAPVKTPRRLDPG